MRIVLKPAGVILLIVMIGILASFSLFNKRQSLEATSTVTDAQSSLSPDARLIMDDSMQLTVSSSQSADMVESKETITGVAKPVVVYKIHVKKTVKDPWNAAIFTSLVSPVAKGEKLRLVFHARSADAGTFAAIFEQNSEPYTKSVNQVIQPNKEWREYSLPFTPLADYGKEKAQITFHLGYKIQTVEVANIRLESSR